MEKRKKPVTAAYLERAALFYLERYSSSRKNLERVLDRKVRRRHEDHSPPSQEEKEWIKQAADKCVNLGFVNDQRYASQKALSMHLSGKSERAIKNYLYHKGLSEEDISYAFKDLEEERGEDADLRAAIIYARKRGFGPFRMRHKSEDREQKDLASMLRAGHSMEQVHKVLKVSSVEELEDILYG
ncbi:RecX family transcriptional regulator [Temperatibacter marinus]|uniref:Regulatory protein RecX n=1 Tax=Temperatibacter marinus TaxID=1456591 RepID=A0AA52EBZ6_9PROT|nr:RecX family transcriptional regulator [Temperatibacter marinus]WND01920.1 RecX family transcriptional regulator [Temperatibacter marinus]